MKTSAKPSFPVNGAGMLTLCKVADIMREEF